MRPTVVRVYLKLRYGAAAVLAFILAACAQPVVRGTSTQSLQGEPRLEALVHVLHATRAQYEEGARLGICEAADLLRTSPDELRNVLLSSGVTMPLLPGCRPAAGQPVNYVFVLNLRSLCNFTIVDLEYVAPSGAYRSDEYELERTFEGWQVYGHLIRTDSSGSASPVQLPRYSREAMPMPPVKQVRGC